MKSIRRIIIYENVEDKENNIRRIIRKWRG